MIQYRQTSGLKGDLHFCVCLCINEGPSHSQRQGLCHPSEQCFWKSSAIEVPSKAHLVNYWDKDHLELTLNIICIYAS